jgi:hypothetical protein
MCNPGRSDTFLITYEVLGKEFVLLDIEPEFSFNEAISFVMDCEDRPNMPIRVDVVLYICCPPPSRRAFEQAALVFECTLKVTGTIPAMRT